jgi:chemotaxis protein methyltransferase CheR
MTSSDLVALEIRLLLEGIYEHYGYDFRNYAATFMRRRIVDFVRRERLATISGLQEKILHDPACLDRFSEGLSVSTTSMFRDPAFFTALRRDVVPLLRTYPFFRIWVAGCATGEEVYSLAILLDEEGIYDRGRIYGTDMNDQFLERAASGSLPLSSMERNAENYDLAGGRQSFQSLVDVRGREAVIQRSYLRNVVFAQHNLVTDSSFNEFNVICCRNVLIYFDRTLQDRVHRLLHGSLRRSGVLALGQKESIAMTSCAGHYETLDERQKLYRKVEPAAGEGASGRRAGPGAAGGGMFN